MSILNKYKKWIRSFNKELNADELYSIAKYGKVYETESIKLNILNYINNKIKSKAYQGEFILTVEVKDDIEKNLDMIIHHYNNQGFTVNILDLQNINVKYLLIIWRK